jgi:hypothetical protein
MSRIDRATASTRADSDRQPPKEGMLRGSLIELRRRCGKAACHCLKGEPHTTPALSYSQKSKTRIVTFSPKDVPKVKAGLKRYQQALRGLEKEAMRGIEALKRSLQREKEQARRARS